MISTNILMIRCNSMEIKIKSQQQEGATFPRRNQDIEPFTKHADYVPGSKKQEAFEKRTVSLLNRFAIRETNHNSIQCENARLELQRFR